VGAVRRAERSWLALAPALALLYVAVGVVVPPEGPGTGVAAVARLCLAAACSTTLVFGPGLAARGLLLARGRPFPLAAVILPGPALMALTGALSWLAAAWVSPHLTAAVLVTPVLAGLVVAARRRPSLDPPSAPWGRRAMVVTMLVLAVALAKGTWSPGPAGELYGGTVSRTLEVGGRSDSRISFHVVQLVAHGTSPYSDRGRSYFAPYSFSHRGPLAGLAASPVVFLSGAHVPLVMPDQPWSPFDAEGFAVYRLALSTMAVTALFALFALASRLLGFRVGYQAALLAALTPFVVHEAYFTWPKLQAGGMVLVAGYLVLERRPGWAGLVAGAAYLVHPMALLSIPALAAVWLLVARGDRESRAPVRVMAGVAWMAAGALACLGAWRLVNGPHFAQLSFVQDNLLQSDTHPVAGVAEWVGGRVTSVLNTLVPLHLVLRSPHHPGVNSIYGPSPLVVVFFLQYWTGVPFGLGIVAFPVLFARLRHALRLAPAAFLAAGVVPLVVFAVFWGGDDTGLLREGMHAWVLILILFVAWAMAGGDPLPGKLGRLEPVLLALRAPETLLMLTVPAVSSVGGLSRRGFLVTDVVSLAVMVAALAWLALETLRSFGDPASSTRRRRRVTGARTAPRGRWPESAGARGRPAR